MNETNALVTTQPLTPSVWQVIEAIAPVMHKCRMFGVTNWEQAATIMIKGHELGLGLAASFEYIHIIQNKPSLAPRGALALIHMSGVLEKLTIKETVDSCTVYMKRVNGFEYETTWTMADAERAGLVKEDSGWKKYPQNMLRWRAIGYCADVVCPDVLGGLKRADEFGAPIDTAGNVIEGEFTVTAEPSKVEETATVVTLDELVTQYGADRVMEAAGGRIPGTLEEVASVAAKLAA